MLANYVKRTALDEGNFRDTARALIADDKIRDQVASTLVEQLYSNTDIAATLKQRLPDNLQPLAVPVAGLVQNATEGAAKQLLARPRVQNLFVNATSLAQRQFVALLNDDKNVLRTTNGEVVLDLRPILTRLGERFSIVSDQIPPDAGRITILKSDQLKTGQRATRALRFVANWIWALALAAWIVAILLVPGRRRLEVRAMAIGILAAGFLILIVRNSAGRYFVDNIVKSDTVRPSRRDAYAILTRLLKGAGLDRRDHRRRRARRRLAHRAGPSCRVGEEVPRAAPERSGHLRRDDRRLPAPALVAADAAVRLLGEHRHLLRRADDRHGGRAAAACT